MSQSSSASSSLCLTITALDLSHPPLSPPPLYTFLVLTSSHCYLLPPLPLTPGDASASGEPHPMPKCTLIGVDEHGFDDVNVTVEVLLGQGCYNDCVVDVDGGNGSSLARDPTLSPAGSSRHLSKRDERRASRKQSISRHANMTRKRSQDLVGVVSEGTVTPTSSSLVTPTGQRQRRLSSRRGSIVEAIGNVPGFEAAMRSPKSDDKTSFFWLQQAQKVRFGELCMTH